jgi:hypothetical protein
MIGNTSAFPVGIPLGVYAFLMVAQSRLWRPGVRRCRWHRVETLDGLPENVPDPIDPSGLTRWKATPPQCREKEIPLLKAIVTFLDLLTRRPLIVSEK